MARRAITALLLLCLAALPAVAQGQKKEPAHKEPAHKKEAPAEKAAPAPANDPVVARVNGTALYRSDLMALHATLPPQVQQQPMDKLYPRLVDQLVAMTLVAQTARKAKVNEEPAVKKMTMIADEQILQDAYFNAMMKKELTEAKIRERYDLTVKNAPPREEVHARHILVPTEDEAKAIIAELKKGADFAKLASEKTTDPAGKASGGDLGYFTENEMVPEFAKAAFALKKGEFTQTPVKTQFGWHIIKVEDRREAKPPTYQEAAPQIARQMAQELYAAKVKELASTATIEVFNADGSRPTPSAAAPPAAQGPATAAAPVGGPTLLPLENGSPGSPPPVGGTPTLAPATKDLGR
ncbi:MAG TPA: peptidylprolyl isomerase [Stellaceae bacterium]|nr:peptidylprolyl isomerase [Stellaceae bacterium]